MRNKNFHSRRIGTINIHTGNYDQKIEIHEVAKAKLSVCYLLVVHNLNNNSVIVTNKQNNVERKYELYWPGHAAKRQHEVSIAIKVEIGIDIEEIIPVSARIILANVLLYG